MLATLKSLGARDSDLAELNLEIKEDMQETCGWSEAAGCYKRGASTIVTRPDSVADRRHMAHEYLHYIWFKHNLDKDRHLTSQLIAFYGNNPSFQQRINGQHNRYVDSGGLQPTEFFSYGCTEVSNAKLGPYIAAKCNEYINTDSLPALY